MTNTTTVMASTSIVVQYPERVDTVDGISVACALAENPAKSDANRTSNHLIDFITNLSFSILKLRSCKAAKSGEKQFADNRVYQKADPMSIGFSTKVAPPR